MEGFDKFYNHSARPEDSVTDTSLFPSIIYTILRFV